MGKPPLKSTRIHYTCNKPNVGRPSAFNIEQLLELEKWFIKVKNKTPSDIDLGIYDWVDKKRLRNWFNNRRSKDKTHAHKAEAETASVSIDADTSGRKSRNVSQLSNESTGTSLNCSIDEYKKELKFVRSQCEKQKVWLKEAEEHNRSLLEQLNALEKNDSIEKKEIERVCDLIYFKIKIIL